MTPGQHGRHSHPRPDPLAVARCSEDRQPDAGTLKLEKHPDKTFIGRIERGFDFLGYHFGPAGLTVAAKTIANFIEKASQLYEQKRSAVLAATALEMYVRRWIRWARSECLDLPDHHEMRLMVSPSLEVRCLFRHHIE